MKSRPPSTPQFPGKLGAEFRRVWRAIQALSPKPTAGSRYQQTTAGVSIYRRDKRAKSGEVIRLDVVEEFDDYLRCQTAAGSTVYCAKPPELQATAWNPGMTTAGEAPIQSTWSLGPGNGNLQYWHGLKYISANMRWLVRYASADGSGEFSVPDILSGTTPLAEEQVSHLVYRQVISPAYTREALSGAPYAAALSSIYAIRVDGLGTTPDGTTIQYLDLNTDRRGWVDESRVNGHVAGTASGSGTTGETIPLEKTQRASIVFDPN